MNSFLGLVGLDRHTDSNRFPSDFSPSSSNNNYYNNYNQEEEGGLANQILSFIGIKGQIIILVCEVFFLKTRTVVNIVNIVNISKNYS